MNAEVQSRQVTKTIPKPSKGELLNDGGSMPESREKRVFFHAAGVTFTNLLAGSQKYILNCRLLHWAHQILTSVDGPCALCGDMNAPAESFETCRV